MKRSASISHSPGDIQRIHTHFGRADELVERRRTIYRLAVELADPQVDSREDLPAAVVDNPVVRAHLGEVLGGVAEYDTRHLSSMDELAVLRYVTWGNGAASQDVLVRIASGGSAERALEGALRGLGAGLASDGIADPVLVRDGSASSDRATEMIVAGVALALDVAPELAGDLLPHVAMFAVLRADSAGRLGSASVREFPGLIILPEPRSASEVAEALVHEGAHQKFFDLALTRRILGDQHSLRFTPPWAPDGRSPWPFDQCVAAFHAYCCLSVFGSAWDYVDGLHADSLLPVATERAAVLGDWLHEHGGALGPDGQDLVALLTGATFGVPPALTDATEPVAHPTSSGRNATRGCGDWTLSMQLSQPVQIVWIPNASVSRGAG